MKLVLCLLTLFLVLTVAAVAQPTVPQNATVNAASYALPGLPNSSIAQGSIFTIFGSNMGPSSSPPLAYPLQTSLGGVSVKVTSGGTTVNAIPVFVSPGQINAILPGNTPVGTASFTVTYNGTSTPSSFQVVASSFGAFTVNSAGNGPGIITDANYQIYGASTSANAGDVSILWGTGLGASAGDDGSAPPKQVDIPNLPLTLYVGLQKATVLYRGRASSTGEDQINFQVPGNVTGCHVPVLVQIGDIVSNFVTMPIATGGRVCSDPAGPSATDLSKFLQQGTVSFGYIGLNRTTTTSPGLPPPFGTGQATTTTTDSGSAVFERYTAQQISFAQNPFQTYTIGACVVFAFGGASAIVTDPIKPVGLDAGNAITVTGPHGAKQLTMSSGGGKGFYSASLGGGSGMNAQPLYLDAGSYTVTGPGGADVVSFSKNLNVPQPLTWTNMDSVNTVVRASGQDVTWSGGDPSGTVSITGASFKIGTNPNGSDSVGAIFTCTAPVSAGHFTIPSPVLLSLPQSTVITPIAGVSISTSTMAVGTISATAIDPPPSTLNIADVTVSVSSGKIVTYQ
jgi:uncharacterized protein (TIGR03437 family)